MENLYVRVNMVDPTEVAELLERYSHAGLYLIAMRPENWAEPGGSDEITETVVYGGCADCLAIAIANKMQADKTFTAIIEMATALSTIPGVKQIDSKH